MRLVKSEDLNHHGTLFAGRTAEWFVESGFIAATNLLDPKSIVCLKIHGMYFTKPVKPGEILKFFVPDFICGKKQFGGVYRSNEKNDEKPLVNGFVTFIHVDENTKPAPHHIEIVPRTAADIALLEEAKNLKKK
ncbi:MAG: acyl-CoA thioesterase [Bacteroidales bacterium]|nr:acyl-CoA thioesterase [Bacteroidales bacterium]